MSKRNFKLIYFFTLCIQFLSYFECGAVQIFVEMLSGKKITIECEPDDTIATIKRKIQDKEGINPEDQTLKCPGYKKNINDSETLKNHYDSHSEAANDHRFQLRIKKPNIEPQEIYAYCDGADDTIGGELKVTCRSSDTIGKIKQQIYDNIKIYSLNNQSFAGNPTSLQDQNISFDEFWDDRRLIAEGGSADGSDVYLDNDDENCFQKIDNVHYLRIRPDDRPKITINVKAGELEILITIHAHKTIKDLKKAIEKKNSLYPVKLQSVIHAGKVLQDDAALSDYNSDKIPHLFLIKQGRYSGTLFIVDPKSPRSRGSIPFEGSDSIYALKKALSNKYPNLPPVDQFFLRSQGKGLEDGRTCADYGLIDGSTIIYGIGCYSYGPKDRKPLFDEVIPLSEDNSSTYNVNVKKIDGANTLYEIKDSTTAFQLKNIIAEKEKLPEKSLILILAGKQLDDSKNLIKDYDILKQNCIHLIVNYSVLQEAKKVKIIEKKEEPKEEPEEGNIKAAMEPVESELEQRIFQLHQSLVGLKQRLQELQRGLTKIGQILSGEKIEESPEESSVDLMEELKKIVKKALSATKKNLNDIINDGVITGDRSGILEKILFDFKINWPFYKEDNQIREFLREASLKALESNEAIIPQEQHKNTINIFSKFMRFLKRKKIFHEDDLKKYEKKLSLKNFFNQVNKTNN